MAVCKEIPIKDGTGVIAPKNAGKLWKGLMTTVPSGVPLSQVEWVKIKIVDEKIKDPFFGLISKFYQHKLSEGEFRIQDGKGSFFSLIPPKNPTIQFHKSVKRTGGASYLDYKKRVHKSGIKQKEVKEGNKKVRKWDEYVFAYYSIDEFQQALYPDGNYCPSANQPVYVNFQDSFSDPTSRFPVVHSICVAELSPCKEPVIPKIELPPVELAPDEEIGDTFQIGTAKLPINPIYLSVERRTNIEQTPILRQPTSLQAGVGHQEIVVSFSCYFYEREQIRKALIPLIAHFRYTPFVPVIDPYLNEEEDIDALALQNLTLSTVEGFPKLIKADITAFKFDWRNYISWPPDDVVTFADCINWFLYRQYMKSLIDDMIKKPIDIEGSDVTFKYIPEGFLKRREADQHGGSDQIFGGGRSGGTGAGTSF